MKLLTFNEAIATLVTINDWLEANQSGPGDEAETETYKHLANAINSIDDAICDLEAMLKTTL
jgi:hypothetical protein